MVETDAAALLREYGELCQVEVVRKAYSHAPSRIDRARLDVVRAQLLAMMPASPGLTRRGIAGILRMVSDAYHARDRAAFADWLSAVVASTDRAAKDARDA